MLAKKLCSIVGEFIHASPFPNAGPELSQEAFTKRSDSPIEIPVVVFPIATVRRCSFQLARTL